ncbi:MULTISPECIES: hypothetical protein [unclassified Pseudodesulfovibrio]|uniref:hypothetical protein n=1 Tax=unclassified Pseudodesulfovibrio TaxID=2661612 RepID=UPI000FEC06DF|nr:MULTISPECIES: hypothetical protein [unclassified Pseudodesulfovibrio]MCJ2163033.1 hypothetical protein [Pseudodesulfovibrio sp. S3-i]RWU07027.1 hypothetical protein DWB63_00530 [Pseudodesulfovibrio sp. S3]
MPDYRWSHYLTAPWELVDEWYRAVKFGIRNLFQWFPVVWPDRHYTSWGLFNVMRYKLVLMQRELSRNPDYVGAECDLHLMHVCELLIDRYFADEYSEHCFKCHEEKWGEMRSFWEPSYDHETGDIDPDYCMSFTDWPNATTPELEMKAWKELRACYEHEHKLADQDIQYLFKLLSKHCRRW